MITWKPLTPAEAIAVPKGSYVRVTNRQGVRFEGVVLFVWWCCGEEAVAVRTPDGGQQSGIPGIGDAMELRA